MSWFFKFPRGYNCSKNVLFDWKVPTGAQWTTVSRIRTAFLQKPNPNHDDLHEILQILFIIRIWFKIWPFRHSLSRSGTRSSLPRIDFDRARDHLEIISVWISTFEIFWENSWKTPTIIGSDTLVKIKEWNLGHPKWPLWTGENSFKNMNLSTIKVSSNSTFRSKSYKIIFTPSLNKLGTPLKRTWNSRASVFS